MTEKNRPSVGFGVFVKKEDQFLIGLRSGKFQAGIWCFPGGHLEYGESFDEAARRETLEETGVLIDNIRHIATTNDIFFEEEKHYVTLFFMADYVSGIVALTEPDKFSEWKWCHWNDLPENIFESTRKLKEQGFNPYDC